MKLGAKIGMAEGDGGNVCGVVSRSKMVGGGARLAVVTFGRGGDSPSQSPLPASSTRALLSELEQRGITQETLNELIAQGLVVFLAPVELYRLAP